MYRCQQPILCCVMEEHTQFAYSVQIEYNDTRRALRIECEARKFYYITGTLGKALVNSPEERYTSCLQNSEEKQSFWDKHSDIKDIHRGIYILYTIYFGCHGVRDISFRVNIHFIPEIES